MIKKSELMAEAKKKRLAEIYRNYYYGNSDKPGYFYLMTIHYNNEWIINLFNFNYPRPDESVVDEIQEFINSVNIKHESDNDNNAFKSDLYIEDDDLNYNLEHQIVNISNDNNECNMNTYSVSGKLKLSREGIYVLGLNCVRSYTAPVLLVDIAADDIDTVKHDFLNSEDYYYLSDCINLDNCLYHDSRDNQMSVRTQKISSITNTYNQMKLGQIIDSKLSISSDKIEEAGINGDTGEVEAYECKSADLHMSTETNYISLPDSVSVYVKTKKTTCHGIIIGIDSKYIYYNSKNVMFGTLEINSNVLFTTASIEISNSVDKPDLENNCYKNSYVVTTISKDHPLTDILYDMDGLDPKFKLDIKNVIGEQFSIDKVESDNTIYSKSGDDIRLMTNDHGYLLNFGQKLSLSYTTRKNNQNYISYFNSSAGIFASKDLNPLNIRGNVANSVLRYYDNDFTIEVFLSSYERNLISDKNLAADKIRFSNNDIVKRSTDSYIYSDSDDIYFRDLYGIPYLVLKR